MYESHSKFSKELKNSMKIKVGQALSGSWVIEPKNILTVLIYNLKSDWPTKISIPFLSSLNNLL